MATVVDLQNKIASIPWANQDGLITGPIMLDLFLTLANLLGVDPFANLPTSQPTVAGVLWNDGGIISRS